MQHHTHNQNTPIPMPIALQNGAVEQQLHTDAAHAPSSPNTISILRAMADGEDRVHITAPFHHQVGFWAQQYKTVRIRNPQTGQLFEGHEEDEQRA
eukprot:956400-Rhodomonas_salina.1